jgi:hypothetical protein
LVGAVAEEGMTDRTSWRRTKREDKKKRDGIRAALITARR